MCIAIGPLYKMPQRSALGRLWWQVAQTPGRLLGLGALLHTLVYALAMAQGRIPSAVHGSLLLMAIGGLLVFAVLMNRFPQWSGRSPLHYMRYGSIFMLMTLALLPYETGIASPATWPWSFALIGLAWLLGLQGLQGYCGWVRGVHRQKARLLLGTLYAACLISASYTLLSGL